jgi:hypothetical protein
MRQKLLVPILAATAPVLFLAAHNHGAVEAHQLLFVLLAATVGAVAVLGLAYCLFREAEPAAVAAALAISLFFLYGHLFDAIWGQGLGWSFGAIHRIVGGSSLVLLALVAAALRRYRGLAAPLLVLMTSIPGAVAAISSVQMGVGLAGELLAPPRPSALHVQSILGSELQPAPARGEAGRLGPEAYPDIYYIVLDGYGREDVLRQYYGFDNSGLIAFLRDRGFFVADQSRANYVMTYLSLCSSLNMAYLGQIGKLLREEKAGNAESSLVPLIRNNRVARFLRSIGYRYVLFRSTHRTTETSDIADVFYSWRSPLLSTEFASMLVDTTALRVFVPSIAAMHLFMLDKIKEVPRLEGPTFTLLHLLVSHSPFVFDRDGAVRRDVPATMHDKHGVVNEGNAEDYLDQIRYLNTRLEEVVDAILATSARRPVIILQSDHGPVAMPKKTGRVQPPAWFTWARAGIFYAVLAPAPVTDRLYPTITPVNTFRILLSELFGAPLEPAEDRVYTSWYDAPFELRDIGQLGSIPQAP